MAACSNEQMRRFNNDSDRVIWVQPSSVAKNGDTRAGPPRGGAGGTLTPGPMDFRGPMKGPMGFRKAVGFSGPSIGPIRSRGAHRNDTEKSACEA